jgi:hypothetical protein
VVSLLEPSVSLTTFAGALLLAAIMLFLVGGYAGVLRQRTGTSVPEGRWAASWRLWRAPYSPASVHQYLLGAGGNGWHLYRVALWWDIVFSAVFALVGFVLLNGLWSATTGVSAGLLLVVRILPFAAGSVDVVEDASLLGAIGRMPVPAGGTLPRPDVVSFAGWCTRLKFVLYTLAILAVPAGAVWLVARGYR